MTITRKAMNGGKEREKEIISGFEYFYVIVSLKISVMVSGILYSSQNSLLGFWNH